MKCHFQKWFLPSLLERSFINNLFVFAIVLLVGLNMCAILRADYREWFEEFREYNVCEFALLLTLLLPTTILFALIYVLSIKPFNRKEK